MKLSAKSYTQIYETVKEYYESDGEDGESIANDCLINLKNNILSFELWDALGSDDLGYVAGNSELKRLYRSISQNWEQSTKGFIN